MTDGSGDNSQSRESRTICLPATEEYYLDVVNVPVKCRAWVMECFSLSNS